MTVAVLKAIDTALCLPLELVKQQDFQFIGILFFSNFPSKWPFLSTGDMKSLSISLLTVAVKYILKVYWSWPGTDIVVWKIQPPSDSSWPSHPLQMVLLVSTQQDDSHKTLFPATHLTLFCPMSLPDSLCPFHFPIRVLLKVGMTHCWSYALL